MDKSVKIIRLEMTDTATIGVMLIAGKLMFFTLENPWKDNTPSISCIPPGKYMCKLIISPKFGKTYEVKNVRGRKHIIFHVGNSPVDTHGCVLLGLSRIPGMEFISDSKEAIINFMHEMRRQSEFELQIIEYDDFEDLVA